MTRLDWVGVQLNQFEMFEEHENYLSRWKLIEYRIVLKNESSEWLDYIELGFNSISLKCLKNIKTVYQDENNLVLVENSVEWKTCINRESKSLELTI